MKLKITELFFISGWEFLESVMACKQTFSGFVSVYNAKYDRVGSPQHFMSVQTFIKWFFAWASRMQVEFREMCHGCQGVPKILACDGTKIGIGFKQSFVTPIETPSLLQQIVNISEGLIVVLFVVLMVEMILK